MVTDRMKASDSVIAALTNLGPKLGAQADTAFSPLLKKGETVPDLALLAALMVRLLEQRSAAMQKADSAHNDELADDAEPRERRDEAARQVYATLVEVKQGVMALFGDSWVAKLRLPNELPQDPAALSRLAEEVQKALQVTKLPKPRLAGVKSFDAEPWIAQLSGPSKDLADALKAVQREAREAQATLIEKSRSVAAFDDVFSKAVSVAAALLRFVGENEHADRLRPSVKRPGTLEPETPVTTGDDAPEPDAGSGSANG
ncbi:MAG: hypothetical protein R3B70_35930 [Polyangiaceae bacterium]